MMEFALFLFLWHHSEIKSRKSNKLWKKQQLIECGNFKNREQSNLYGLTSDPIMQQIGKNHEVLFCNLCNLNSTSFDAVLPVTINIIDGFEIIERFQWQLSWRRGFHDFIEEGYAFLQNYQSSLLN